MKTTDLLQNLRLLWTIGWICIYTTCSNTVSGQEFRLPTPLNPDQHGYAPVNGINMYYEVYGEGQPILLLHGAYTTIGLNWSELIPGLAKTRKVIAVELQGHGHTNDTDRPLSYADLASDVAGVMKYLKVESADILGYSFGGTVAWALTFRYPELVQKLIVISSGYDTDSWNPLLPEILASFQPDFLDQTPLKAEYMRIAPDSSHWHAFVRKMIDFDKQPFSLGEENFSRITCPVLLISGDNDAVDLTHLVATYKLLGGGQFGDITGLPKSQLAILPGSTHVGLIMQTQNLLNIIVPFLQ